MLKKQIIHTFFYNSISFLIRLTIFPIIVKSFSLSDYGSYGIIGQIIAFGTLIGSAELYSYLRKELPGKDRESQIQMFKSVHIPAIFILSFLVVTSIVFGIPSMLSNFFGNNAYTDVINIAIMIIIPSVLVTDIIRYFRSIKQIQISNKLNFLFNQGWALSLILFFFFGHQITLSLWIINYLIFGIITAVIGLYFISFKSLLGSKINLQIIKNAVIFSFIILLTVIIAQSELIFSRMIIIDLLSIKSLGFLYFASKLPDIISNFSITIINLVSNPYLIETINNGDRVNQASLGGKIIVSTLTFYFLLSIPLILNLNEVILFIGTAEYLQTISMIKLLFIIGIFNTLQNPFYYYNFAKGYKTIILRNSILKFIILILGTIIFVNYFGIVGAVYAMILGSLVNLLLYYLPLKRSNIIQFPTKFLKVLTPAILITFILLVLSAQLNILINNQISIIVIQYFTSFSIPLFILYIFKKIRIEKEKKELSIVWN